MLGANARCIAMLDAFKRVINDYNMTDIKNKRFSREILLKINPCIQYLTDCRGLSISMANAIRWLKQFISELSDDLTMNEAKNCLITQINDFISQRIKYADTIIAQNICCNIIKNNDIILTYQRSFVIEKALILAKKMQKKNFKVVIVDSRPHLHGKILLKNLIENGIECSYTHLNGLSYVCKDVTKVLLGASSVLSNGSIAARVGTAMISMMAHNYQIPVAICCETYKFSERIQLDAICNNEIGLLFLCVCGYFCAFLCVVQLHKK